MSNFGVGLKNSVKTIKNENSVMELKISINIIQALFLTYFLMKISVSEKAAPKTRIDDRIKPITKSSGE